MFDTQAAPAELARVAAALIDGSLKACSFYIAATKTTRTIHAVFIHQF